MPRILIFLCVVEVNTFKWILMLVKPYEEHLLLVLMKIKLGLLNKDIAIRFNIHNSRVSKILRNWIPRLANVLSSLIFWPGRGAIRKNLPPSFKKKWKDVVSIIDCGEIFIERPKNLIGRVQTWSNYKHNNAAKYLIGITPSGAIMF